MSETRGFQSGKRKGLPFLPPASMRLARAMPLHATPSSGEQSQTTKHSVTEDSQALCVTRRTQGGRGGGATARTGCMPSKGNASPACGSQSRPAATPALVRDTADTRPHLNAHLSPSTCVSQRSQLTLGQNGPVASLVGLLPVQSAWPSRSARVACSTPEGYSLCIHPATLTPPPRIDSHAKADRLGGPLVSVGGRGLFGRWGGRGVERGDKALLLPLRLGPLRTDWGGHGQAM